MLICFEALTLTVTAFLANNLRSPSPKTVEPVFSHLLEIFAGLYACMLIIFYTPGSIDAEDYKPILKKQLEWLNRGPDHREQLTLSCKRMALKRFIVTYSMNEKKAFALFAAMHWCDGQEHWESAVKNASIFNSNWLENIWLQHDWLFVDFSNRCLPRCSPSLPSRWVHNHLSPPKSWQPLHSCLGNAGSPRH